MLLEFWTSDIIWDGQWTKIHNKHIVVLPIDGVLIPLADVRYAASHDMVGGRIDMVMVVCVHGMVHMGWVVQTAERRPVRHVGFVDATRRRAVDVSRMDSIIILEKYKKILLDACRFDFYLMCVPYFADLRVYFD